MKPLSEAMSWKVMDRAMSIIYFVVNWGVKQPRRWVRVVGFIVGIPVAMLLAGPVLVPAMVVSMALDVWEATEDQVR